MQQASKLLVISTVFPGFSGGSGIAAVGTLEIYRRHFDQITYVALLEKAVATEAQTRFQDVEFIGLGLPRASLLKRFLATAVTRTPAVCAQFVSKSAFSLFKLLLGTHLPSSSHLVFEHLTPSIYFHRLKRCFAGKVVAFRSLDVLTSAFSELAGGPATPAKWAWGFEIAKIRALERATLLESQFVWSITPEDASEYETLFGRKASGVIEVAIETDRFAPVLDGDPLRVLFLGGVDARKAHGLRWFLESVWPLVRKKEPRARILLGGFGTNNLSNDATGIIGLGEVKDEIEFLNQGKVFINPQLSGSGIKLKSLNALAARKTLVSTVNGSRGIPGINLRHFCVATEASMMADQILRCISDQAFRTSIADAGAALVREKYSPAAIYARADPLVSTFKRFRHE
jgi:glycosyltransferase involved in cell wall biosynthesis